MKTLITVTLVIAAILMVIPISFQWRWCRPEFLVLLVIYWSMFTPQHFGLVGAWFVGLFQDLLELTPLGFNALGMLLISYIAYLVYQRIRNYVLWHQAAWVFVLVGVFQLFSNWLGGFFGKTVDSPIFLIAAVLSACIWPFLVILMGRLTIRLRLVH
ncbi:MAG: rod shape-determining protein MreD [Cellvibrionaceae bacterium]